MAWKPQGEFQHEWFLNLTAPLWDKFILPQVAAMAGPLRYLEIGVADGMSMLYAIDHFGRPGGLFVGVDPFWPSRRWHVNEGNEHRERAVKNLSARLNADPFEVEFDRGGKGVSFPMVENDSSIRCELLCEDSLKYMHLEHREFDIMYVDGNHEAPAALQDMCNCWRLLKLGGLMIVDDAERRYRGGMPSVAVALDAFEHCYHGYFDVVYRHPKQVCYVKRQKRQRGKYPPTMVATSSIVPAGATSDYVER